MPGDVRERETADPLRALLLAHDDAFDRTLAVGHVTGSTWIVDRTGRQALLLHHRKLDRWLQPGGHADDDRDVRLTSLTFASDAIYDVDVHDIPARANEIAHRHHDVRFAFFADASERPRETDESHDVA